MPTMSSCSSSSQLFECPECPKKSSKILELQNDLEKTKKDKENLEKHHEELASIVTTLENDLAKEKILRETAETRLQETASQQSLTQTTSNSSSSSTSPSESEISSLHQLVAQKDEEITALAAMVKSREQAVSEAIELVSEHKRRASLAEQRFARLQASVRAQGGSSLRESADMPLSARGRQPREEYTPPMSARLPRQHSFSPSDGQDEKKTVPSLPSSRPRSVSSPASPRDGSPTTTRAPRTANSKVIE